MGCFPNLTMRLPNLAVGHGEIGVTWARTHAIYGPWTALFTLCAYAGDLKPMLEQPIEMCDEAGNVYWCGFVDEAYRCCGEYMAWGWSSQNILNRVAVAYTVGGEARRTQFAQDAASVATYGQREAVIALPADTLWPTPELYRDRILAEFSQPRPILHNTYTCACDLTYLHASGAWRSLAWQRYENLCGLMQAAPEATGPRAFGLGFVSDQIGFSGAGYIGSIGNEWAAFANGETIVISGAAQADNNQVTNIVKRVGDVTTITTTGLSFDPADDVRDVNHNMNRFVTNQMIHLTAPVVLNAGYHFVKRVLTDGSRVEVRGGDIVNESVVGQAAIIVASVSVQVDADLDDESPGAVVMVLGYAQMICQPVCNSCGEPTTINQVQLKLRKRGTPADGVRVSLCSDCTTVLESQMVDGNSVASSFDWFTVSFAHGAAVDAGGCAYVRIERAGAPDTESYFEVATTTESTRHYALISPDGVQWRSAGYAVAVVGVATQGVSALAAQMLAGWAHGGTVTDHAQIMFPVPTYRAGTQSLLYELEQLLALGDPRPEGTRRRLRLRIDCDANVVLEKEPDQNNCVIVDCDGVPSGEGLPAGELCALPAGEWICPPAGLNDVPGVFLQWFELKTGSKTCRARYVERDFGLDDLGYVLHWSGVA